jgi:type I restriction enzyme R subunit
VLDALLDKYADEGVDDIEDIQVLRVQPLTKFGTPVEIIEKFGGRDAYMSAVRELETALYATAP